MYSAETPYRLVPAPPRMALLPSGVDEDCLSDYQTADDATVNTVRTANTMDEQTARRKYGLKNWRKYALYKHGNNPKFLNSTQGREILKANFRNEMKQDLDGLARWINAVDSAEAAMEEELHQTRAENAALMSRVSSPAIKFQH